MVVEIEKGAKIRKHRMKKSFPNATQGMIIDKGFDNVGSMLKFRTVISSDH